MARVRKADRARAALALFNAGFSFAEVGRLLRITEAEGVALVRYACGGRR